MSEVAQVETPSGIVVAEVSRRVARLGGELVDNGITLIAFGIDQASFDQIISDVRAGVPILPSQDDVRAEASRRMQWIAGARDKDHLTVIVSNASREAIRLLRKGEANWTTEEAQRATELELMDKAIEAIRAASNTLEVMSAIPADYTADTWWPSLSP